MKQSIGAKTIVYPTPVFVVGTYDKDGKANAMTVAWGGICCSVPPCVAISVQEVRYTYGNLMEHQAFTISIPSETQAEYADYFGIVSGKNEDKFAKSGLTPIKSDLVNAPYIKEFPFILECKVIHHHKIGLHTQFIGEILDIKVDEDAMTENRPDSGMIKPIMWAPDDLGYYGIGNFLGKAFSIGKSIKNR
jgi:flavin reductase (DIM6/NTAB) family NADH-FMN oxidoreductase RutF